MAGGFRFAKFIDDWLPKIGAAFTSGVANLREKVRIAFVGERLQTAGVMAGVQAVGLDPVALREFDQAIALAFEAGGDGTAGEIPPYREPDGAIIQIRFDVRHQRAEEWLRNHSGQLIQDILQDQREAIRQHLAAGLEAGRNPRDVALDLVGRISPGTGKREGGVIGLTASQEAWSRNYAAELAAGDPNALTRALRDKRFDRAVAKAIEDGAPIPADLQAKMVAAYRTRALRYRAITIAETEAHAALGESQYQATLQAIEANQILMQDVTKTWRDSGDRKVRHTHQAMNGQTVGFLTDFISPSGAQLRFPGDARAPAAERIGCRCHSETKFARRSSTF